MKYVFRCTNCQDVKEVEGTIGQSPEPPTCCGPVVRVFQSPGIVYRCSGFYHTDKVLYNAEPYDDDD